MDKAKSSRQDTDSERSYKKENQKLKEQNRTLKKQNERLRKELKRFESRMSDVEDILEDEAESGFEPPPPEKKEQRFCPKCNGMTNIFHVNSPAGRIYIEKCTSCTYKKRLRGDESA